MPKKKVARKLAALDQAANAKPLIELIATWQEKAKKAKAAAVKDGKFDRNNQKYRTALKHLKRAQRKLKKERIRAYQPPKKEEAAPAAAPAAEPAAAAS